MLRIRFSLAGFLVTVNSVAALYGQTEAKQSVTEFNGHKVILVEPKRDANGWATESYKLCFDSPTPPRHCFKPSERFGPVGSVTDLRPIDLGRGRSGLFIATAANFGGPGTIVELALLDFPNPRDEIENRLFLEGYLSEISYYDFWNESSISDAPIFITANYVWGAEVGRFSDHRFIISSYVLREDKISPESFYYRLDDRYMTVNKYTSDDKSPVLSREKPEILARLKRVNAERERQAKAQQ